LYERLAAAESGPVLAFGHTHKPWVREYGRVLFVNCGSVGKPKDGDPRAAFVVLRATRDGVGVTIERAPYDAGAVAAEVREAGLPGEFADKLLIAA
jgi:predicted phosphodiesterase